MSITVTGDHNYWQKIEMRRFLGFKKIKVNLFWQIWLQTYQNKHFSNNRWILHRKFHITNVISKDGPWSKNLNDNNIFTVAFVERVKSSSVHFVHFTFFFFNFFHQMVNKWNINQLTSHSYGNQTNRVKGWIFTVFMPLFVNNNLELQKQLIWTRNIFSKLNKCLTNKMNSISLTCCFSY